MTEESHYKSPIRGIGACFGAHLGGRLEKVVAEAGSREGELVSEVSQNSSNMLASCSEHGQSYIGPQFTRVVMVINLAPQAFGRPNNDQYV